MNGEKMKQKKDYSSSVFFSKNHTTYRRKSTKLIMICITKSVSLAFEPKE